MARKRFVIANWKMHPDSPAAAKKLFDAIKRRAARTRRTSVVVCPPTLFLGSIAASYSGRAIGLGAQDVSVYEKEGSYTGEVSAQQLLRAGIDYCIVGHSERRRMGEADAIVAEKARAALRAGLQTVLCIGERDRDPHGAFLRFVESQLRGSLKGVSRTLTKRLLVAYEPVWAIGKRARDAMSPQDVHKMVLFVRKTLVRVYGRKAGLAVPILYGGSVEPDNVSALVQESDARGFLVGHESLVPGDFAAIVRATDKLA